MTQGSCEGFTQHAPPLWRVEELLKHCLMLRSLVSTLLLSIIYGDTPHGNIVAPPFKDRSPLRRSLDFDSFSFLPSFPSSPHLSSPSLPFSLVFVILFPLLPPLLSRLFLLLTYLPSSSIPSPPFFTISSLFSVFFSPPPVFSHLTFPLFSSPSSSSVQLSPFPPFLLPLSPPPVTGALSASLICRPSAGPCYPPDGALFLG